VELDHVWSAMRFVKAENFRNGETFFQEKENVAALAG
jgi:hypothetical protein